MNARLEEQLSAELGRLREAGTYKRFNTLASPQGPVVTMAGRGAIAGAYDAVRSPRPSGSREMETASFRSSPTMRFLGGVGVMLLAITVGAAIITYILGMLPPGPPPSGEDAILTGIMGYIAGNILGLAGLAWFSIRRSDWMPILGGFTCFALEFLILYLLGI